MVSREQRRRMQRAGHPFGGTSVGPNPYYRLVGRGEVLPSRTRSGAATGAAAAATATAIATAAATAAAAVTATAITTVAATGVAGRRVHFAAKTKAAAEHRVLVSENRLPVGNRKGYREPKAPVRFVPGA